MQPLISLKESLALTDAQWTEVWLKLRLHTWRRYRWLHDRTGEDLDEIAHQALVDTWNGTRRWPPVDRDTGLIKKNVDLFSFLCKTVQSIVYHTWQRKKAGIPLDHNNSVNDASEFDWNPIERSLAINHQSVVVGANEFVTQLDYARLTGRILELVSNDKEVSEIVKLWLGDPGLKPREIAEQLHMTMREMQAAQKRLRRLVSDLRRGKAK